MKRITKKTIKNRVRALHRCATKFKKCVDANKEEWHIDIGAKIMKIVIYKHGKMNFIWEYVDGQGHSICRCTPRHGQGYYTTFRACLASAKRFKKKIFHRCLYGVNENLNIYHHLGGIIKDGN